MIIIYSRKFDYIQYLLFCTSNPTPITNPLFGAGVNKLNLKNMWTNDHLGLDYIRNNL